MSRNWIRKSFMYSCGVGAVTDSKVDPKIISMGKIACLPYITSYGVHLVALLMDVFNANMIPGKISFHWFCGTSKSSSNDRNNSLIVHMLRSAKPLPSLWYPEVLRFSKFIRNFSYNIPVYIGALIT